jgi:hypothetical protein
MAHVSLNGNLSFVVLLTFETLVTLILLNVSQNTIVYHCIFHLENNLCLRIALRYIEHVKNSIPYFLLVRSGAMKINSAISNSTQKDLEVELRKWFTNARDRGIGSRKKNAARTISIATDGN